ncbi:MAG: hypothetical protein NZM35_06610 [Chitinophagales bacterium]|nr:hypothetical protein [Chitinophagales bacterium]MDW8420079.1 hypothetical protein [Chitinophagales bacterium]
MTQISTQELLILYVYGEISPEDRARLLMELSANPGLQDELHKLKEIKNALQDAYVSPSETSVKIVTQYIRNTTEELHEIE